MTASFAIKAGTWGFVAANALLVSVRFFARSQGLKVQWWSRSYAPERELLRKIAASPDTALARRAGRYLRTEVAAWTVFALSAVVFFWGAANR